MLLKWFIINGISELKTTKKSISSQGHSAIIMYFKIPFTHNPMIRVSHAGMDKSAGAGSTAPTKRQGKLRKSSHLCYLDMKKSFHF